MVISVKNPVFSVFFLILTFISAAGVFLMFGIEFIPMVYIILYVGAIAILFLFVVMMLDIKLVELIDIKIHYFPIVSLLIIMFFFDLYFFLESDIITTGLIMDNNTPYIIDSHDTDFETVISHPVYSLIDRYLVFHLFEDSSLADEDFDPSQIFIKDDHFLSGIKDIYTLVLIAYDYYDVSIDRNDDHNKDMFIIFDYLYNQIIVEGTRSIGSSSSLEEGFPYQLFNYINRIVNFLHKDIYETLCIPFTSIDNMVMINPLITIIDSKINNINDVIYVFESLSDELNEENKNILNFLIDTNNYSILDLIYLNKLQLEETIDYQNTTKEILHFYYNMPIEGKINEEDFIYSLYYDLYFNNKLSFEEEETMGGLFIYNRYLSEIAPFINYKYLINDLDLLELMENDAIFSSNDIKQCLNIIIPYTDYLHNVAQIYYDYFLNYATLSIDYIKFLNEKGILNLNEELQTLVLNFNSNNSNMFEQPNNSLINYVSGLFEGTSFSIILEKVLSTILNKLISSNEKINYIIWSNMIASESNIETIGQVLYTYYFALFIIAGLILLVAMIGAIVLTLYSQTKVKRQDIYKQTSRHFSKSVYFK